jgi:hypothetical protein
MKKGYQKTIFRSNEFDHAWVGNLQLYRDGSIVERSAKSLSGNRNRVFGESAKVQIDFACLDRSYYAIRPGNAGSARQWRPSAILKSLQPSNWGKLHWWQK